MAATRAGYVAVDGRAAFVVSVVLVLSFFGLFIMAESGRLRARMIFDRDSFSLEHSLGLRRRIVLLPANMEVGSVWEHQRASAVRSGDYYVWEDDGSRHVGSYLRIHGESGSIRVLTSSTSVRQYWDSAGLRTGPKRFCGDIKLTAPDFVALECLLASRGMLSLRPG